MLHWVCVIGLCLSWCSLCEISCWMVSPLLTSYAEKGKSEEKGDRFRICSLFHSQEGEKWEAARRMWHRFTYFWCFTSRSGYDERNFASLGTAMCFHLPYDSRTVTAQKLVHCQRFKCLAHDHTEILCFSWSHNSWNLCQYPAPARLAYFSHRDSIREKGILEQINYIQIGKVKKKNYNLLCSKPEKKVLREILTKKKLSYCYRMWSSI